MSSTDVVLTSEVPADLWAQCETCDKWRKLPPGTFIDESSSWFCNLHPDPAMASCSVPEEVVVAPAPVPAEVPLRSFSPVQQPPKSSRGRRPKSETQKRADAWNASSQSLDAYELGNNEQDLAHLQPFQQSLEAQRALSELDSIVEDCNDAVYYQRRTFVRVGVGLAEHNAAVSTSTNNTELAGGIWLPSPSVPALQHVTAANSRAADMFVKTLDVVSADLYFSPGMPHRDALLAAVSGAVLATTGATDL